MSEPVVRDDFSRGEAVGGLVWLSVGAAVSVLMEVVYLSSMLFGVPFPLSIPVAFLFNMVLTRTALLWTCRRGLALIPAAVWICGFMVLLAIVPATGNALVPNNILAVILLFAGIAGGVWPVLARE